MILFILNIYINGKSKFADKIPESCLDTQIETLLINSKQ